MANPVVHFEIIGKDAQNLRRFYAQVFGWTFDTSPPVAATISDAGNYGFIDRIDTPDGGGIPGGIGGGAEFVSQAVFYIGVPDVAAALQQAEALGGKRHLEPSAAPGGMLIVAQFTDPEGNLIGLAGPK